MEATKEQAQETMRVLQWIEDDVTSEDTRFMFWKIIQIREFLKAAERVLPPATEK